MKKTFKERIYLTYRQIKAFASRILFLIMRIFPVKRNLVSVCTFEGKTGFSCSPRYIVEKLHEIDPKIEFVWLVNNLNCTFPDYIKKVSNGIISRAYWLNRSKIWIDNYRKPYGTVKRKTQYYINTWHATIGFKCIGLWRGAAFSEMAYLVSKNDSEMIDRVVIDSEWCKEFYPKGLIYSGRYMNVGYPRCDVLYGNKEKIRKEVRSKYGLAENIRIAMFAPTYREGAVDGKRHIFSEISSLDFKKFLGTLSEKFGGIWYLGLRLHPQLMSQNISLNPNISEKMMIDFSKEDDMNSVLAAMDVFITDYSSAAMEACLAEIPVFIYADDINKYIEDRGNFLWDISRLPEMPVKNNKKITPGIDVVLPFSVSENNDQLEDNIRKFDSDEYRKMISEFIQNTKMIFDGKASERVAKRISKYMRL